MQWKGFRIVILNIVKNFSLLPSTSYMRKILHYVQDDVYDRRMKRIIKWLLIIFFTPLLLAFILIPLYSVIPPISIPIAGRAMSGKEIHWRWRSFDEISPQLSRMIISAEDDRFCQHNGVDWLAVEKVVDKATKRGKLTRGASTIPMQVAKNLFLWPLPDIVRKPIEVPLAMWMDLVWSKQRVMEIYMNIAQFGPGIYGAEAAARFYFDKPAADLNSSEAAALAAILPSPEKRDPENPTKYVAHYAFVIKSRASRSLLGCLR
jgi:monofunctional biosynthetic peptidoglycan transglycosylase